MATNKVSSKNFELIKEEMIRQGIDVSNFKTDILVEDGVISSSTRSSIQFKDKNDNYWRASLTWKSVEKGVEGRNDSEDMKKMKAVFEKAKEEYGIALVSIWSDCPQKMVDVIVQDVLDEIINEEVA